MSCCWKGASASSSSRVPGPALRVECPWASASWTRAYPTWWMPRVIHDRLILQEDGIVMVTLLVDPQTRDLVGDPTILSRGFVVLSDDQAYGTLLRSAAPEGL